MSSSRPAPNIRYSYGTEWRNSRGQWFVMLRDMNGVEPEHPMARKDGFYPRARFVFEEQLQAGTVRVVDMNDVNEKTKGPIIVATPFDTWDVEDLLAPRFVAKENLAYHLDTDAGNDEPENLALFSNTKAMSQFRSAQYHKSKNQNYRDRLKGLTEAQKEKREIMGTERAQQAEIRSKRARDAHAARKKREVADRKAAKEST